MKKTIFECDVCKGLGITIFTANISVQKTILSGTEDKNHKVPAMEAGVQVCSLPCLIKAIEEKFKFGMARIEIKNQEEKTNGDLARDAQANPETGEG